MAFFLCRYIGMDLYMTPDSIKVALMKKKMQNKGWLLSSILIVLLFLIQIHCWSQESLDKYLHKNAKLGIGLASEELFLPSGTKPITPRAAAGFAVYHLKRIGVKDIVVCESHWIAASISGYLVDSQGSLTIGDKHFSVFRIGIRDGLEKHHGEDYKEGTKFVFIALGWGNTGKPLWYPDPGPDYKLAKDEGVTEGMLSYEYLLYRKEFESLPVRYKYKKKDRWSRVPSAKF